MTDPQHKAVDAFRVPNSIVQGVTTETPAELNRLSAFQTVVLFGLLAKVSAAHPEREVRTTIAEILDIVEVGRSMAHAVDRTWKTADGGTKQRRYAGRRHSPRQRDRVHEALLELFQRSVVVTTRDGKQANRRQTRMVHLLDSFGYEYRVDGRLLDPHDLPPTHDRVNVGNDDRPVWRVRRKDADARRERPTAVLFRINAELAAELSGRRGTIGFSLFARKVFGLFHRFSRQASVIRLIVLVLRQTKAEFVRRVPEVLDELGFDASHPQRARDDCRNALERLTDAGIVADHTFEADRLRIVMNRDWYRGEEG